MNLYTAVMTRLLAQPAIVTMVGDRVQVGSLAENTPSPIPPTILLGELNVTEGITHDGQQGRKRTRVIIKCCSALHNDAMELRRLAQVAFRNYRGTVTVGLESVTFIQCLMVQPEYWYRDKETNSYFAVFTVLVEHDV
jgi:hypothetical protein